MVGSASYLQSKGYWTISLSDGSVIDLVTTSTAKISSNPERMNAIYYSEPDEPESVPPSQNCIQVVGNTPDNDYITGLVPFGGVLWVLKQRHTYRFTFVVDPRYDGAVRLAFSRGALNHRCCVYFQDTAYVLDQFGPWRLTEGGCDPIGAQVQNLFSEGTVDFSKSRWFFVSVEPNEGIVRFHVAYVGDSSARPKRAVCYSTLTEAWWTESYDNQLGGSCHIEDDGRMRSAVGGEHTVVLLQDEGTSDRNSHNTAGRPIAYTSKTGLWVIPVPPGVADKSLMLTYRPTENKQLLKARLYYDDQDDPQEFASNGSEAGVSLQAGSSDITINLKRAPGTFGNCPGYRRFSFKGRADKRATTHRFLAVELHGTQKSEAITISGLDLEGAD